MWNQERSGPNERPRGWAWESVGVSLCKEINNVGEDLSVGVKAGNIRVHILSRLNRQARWRGQRTTCGSWPIAFKLKNTFPSSHSQADREICHNNQKRISALCFYLYFLGSNIRSVSCEKQHSNQSFLLKRGLLCFTIFFDFCLLVISSSLLNLAILLPES